MITTFECIFELFSTLGGAVGAIVEDFLYMDADEMMGMDAQFL